MSRRKRDSLHRQDRWTHKTHTFLTWLGTRITASHSQYRHNLFLKGITVLICKRLHCHKLLLSKAAYSPANSWANVSFVSYVRHTLTYPETIYLSKIVHTPYTNFTSCSLLLFFKARNNVHTTAA